MLFRLLIKPQYKLKDNDLSPLPRTATDECDFLLLIKPEKTSCRKNKIPKGNQNN